MSHPERSANPRLMVVDSLVSTLDHAVGAATDRTDTDPVIETVVDTVTDSGVTNPSPQTLQPPLAPIPPGIHSAN